MAENNSNESLYSRASPPVARIIIVCFKSASVITECLNALAVQTRSDFEVVVVNNEPKEADIIKRALPDSRFRVVEPGVNLGFAQGSNHGADGACTQWVVTLNPDAFPASNWFENLMAGASRHPHASSLGSVLISAENATIWDGLGDCYSIFGVAWRGAQGWPRRAFDIGQTDRRIMSACGAAAAYKTSVFRKQGGFDPEYFCYLEDMDLGLRLALAGHQTILIVSAEVFHLSGQSTGGDNFENSKTINDFTVFHSHRNSVRLLMKVIPIWLLPIALAAFFCSQIWLLFRKRKEPHWKSQRKGLIAGLKRLPDHWRSRKAVQQRRRISALKFAKNIKWSPKALRRKPPDF